MTNTTNPTPTTYEHLLSAQWDLDHAIDAIPAAGSPGVRDLDTIRDDATEVYFTARRRFYRWADAVAAGTAVESPVVREAWRSVVDGYGAVLDATRGPVVPLVTLG